ncbi:hypothetical protein HKX48_006566, partial [Thoreauomyces humboldtii]
PCLKLLDPKSSAYKSVADQFDSTWRHPMNIKAKGNIYAVYKIQVRPDIMKRYDAYREKVEASGKFSGKKNGTKVLTRGNEQRRFHGTSLLCNLGMPNGTVQFCKNSGCSTCSIIQSSFDMRFYGATSRVSSSAECFGTSIGHSLHAFRQGTLGRGIYTSATSSKSHDYTKTARPPYRAMLLNTVVCGKIKRMSSTATHLTDAPSGFDAVVGEPDGLRFNYDELGKMR